MGIGQITVEFIVDLFITLYLAFFLIRDGDALARTLRHAVPLAAAHRRELVGKFTVVIRATVKGNPFVAALQGLVALYFLLTGALWQGAALVAWGVLIGLVDNVLRPILVGKDTRLPDYVVLMTTLGGMVVFGINGFVLGPAIAAMFIAVWHLYGSTRSDSSG